MSAAISIKHLDKSFGETSVLRDFGLDIEDGTITAIIGPNASGKSTLLNILAGIMEPDDGVFDMRHVGRFSIGYIFQNYRESLLPWRTNFENVALPLEIQGKNENEILERVGAVQKLFEFECDWNGYPYQLSGGQQQILAFIRALVTEPKILFVDEPFSALDYENNLRLREHLQKYYLAFKPTIVLVTHNIEEAVHLAEKIVVFSRKPTTVLATIDNPLPYPRTIEMLASYEFDRVADQVLSVFRKAAQI
jgi:NitT/TauT family transport system ATP-binding protein